MRIRILLIAAAVLFGLAANGARASEMSAFNTAVADAYGHYRQAVYYLRRSASPDTAALELESFIEKWRTVVARFGGSPPDAYADDPKWRNTLDGIAARADEALAALDKDDPETAKKTLDPILVELGDLRRRNGVFIYADRVNELGDEVGKLARFRRGLKDFFDAGQVDAFARKAAIVAYLLDRVDTEAPGDLARDEGFRRLIDGFRESMDKVWKALKTEDLRLLRIGIGEIRSYERILFLRYG